MVVLDQLAQHFAARGMLTPEEMDRLRDMGIRPDPIVIGARYRCRETNTEIVVVSVKPREVCIDRFTSKGTYKDRRTFPLKDWYFDMDEPDRWGIEFVGVDAMYTGFETPTPA